MKKRLLCLAAALILAGAVLVRVTAPPETSPGDPPAAGTAAPSSAKTGFFNFFNNRIGIIGFKNVCQRLIASYCNCFVNTFSINVSAVCKGCSSLFCIKVYIFIFMYMFMCFRISVEKSFHRFIIFYMAFVNFFNILNFNLYIGDVFVRYNYQNPLFTETMAAGWYGCHFVVFC